MYRNLPKARHEVTVKQNVINVVTQVAVMASVVIVAPPCRGEEALHPQALGFVYLVHGANYQVPACFEWQWQAHVSFVSVLS